jgi:UDP-3-O-[3-hydroxymyristoyl] N-acetylglucosamine deacetylase
MPRTPPARPQRTLRTAAIVHGRGYWSGHENRVELHPAAVGSGIVFVRGDLAPPASVPAFIGAVVEARNRTQIVRGPASVHLIEHVMSALAGLSVDNCTVVVSAEELPGMDGSSRDFVAAIDRAGIVEQDAAVDPISVGDTVRVGDAATWIEAGPPRFAGLSIEYLLDYGPGPIGRQRLDIDITPAAYRNELSSARTFISTDDAARFRAAGLGATVSPGDLVVFSAEGPIGTELRWPDECVRHKVLDAVGDLALAGRPLHAHVRAFRSGHALNAGLVRELVARDATRWLGRTA